MLSSTEQRASLNRRDIREDAHECATPKARETTLCLAHEMREHLLRSFKVRHDAVEHRRDHCHTARLASVLLSRFATDVNRLARRGIDGNERRLVNHHTATGEAIDIG